MDRMNIPAKFDVRSFTHSWDNMGYLKKLESPWIRQHSLFSKILKGLLFACTLWIYLPNLNFVAFRVPEIIAGTVKICEVPGYAQCPRTLFSQIFNRLLFAWTLWIYLQNLKFVVLHVPEIIGCTGQITWWRHLWRHEACIDYPCGSFGMRYAVDDFAKIWSNSDKNCGRYSMLKVVMSQLWRDRSRDVIGEVTIGWPLTTLL